MSNYIQDIAYLENWFQENDICFITPYIENHFHTSSWNYEYWFMKKHLYFAKIIIEEDMMSNEEKQDLFFKELVHSDNREGKIILVEGMMGGGKTGFGCWAIDEYKKKKPNLKYFFVTRSQNKPLLPEWFKSVEDINDVENDAVALVDEGAIQLSSRRSMMKENIEAAETLVQLRQKGITLIILVQNTKMVDANVRRLASVRVLKFGLPFNDEGEERSEEMDLIRQRLRPRNFTEVYIELRSNKKSSRFTHGLPLWWDKEKTSKYMRNLNLTKQRAEKEKGRLERLMSERQKEAAEQLEFEKKRSDIRLKEQSEREEQRRKARLAEKLEIEKTRSELRLKEKEHILEKKNELGLMRVKKKPIVNEIALRRYDTDNV